MGQKAPPLEIIEAFFVATSCESFSEASHNLALSPATLARRIQKLETFVGVPLFVANAVAPKLTLAGKEYLEQIRPSMEAIRSVTVHTRGTSSPGSLRLLVAPSIATGWLVRRLPEFYAQGGSQVQLLIDRDLPHLRSGHADLALTSDEPEVADLDSDSLIELQAAPVFGGFFADGRAPLATPSDLQRHRLLELRSSHIDLWQHWFASAHAPEAWTRTTLKFDTPSLMYEAAADGNGVALATPLMDMRQLRDGRLQFCFATCVKLGIGLRLAYRDDSVARRRDVQQLRSYLRVQLRKSEAEFHNHLRNSATPSPAQRPASGRGVSTDQKLAATEAENARPWS